MFTKSKTSARRVCGEHVRGAAMANMEKDVKIRKEKGKMPVNSRLLDLFWDLAEGGDDVRIQATEKMITILTEKQKNDAEPCKELEYATKRLLKGLASSRKLARLGFATTLCQLLRAFPVLDTSTILEKMKSELQITCHDLKSDQSNIMLGRVMGYLVLIQSGTLFKSSNEDIGQVVKLLVTTRTKKVPIHQLCVQALCQIIAKTTSETFTLSVWDHLEKELSSGWDTCSPDTLLLLMTVNKHHPSTVGKEFLSKHWKCKKIVAEKNFDHLKDIMKKSTIDHPLIHNVCPELVRRAMKTNELFSAFWTKVVSDKLITQKMERRYLGFQLVIVALENSSTTEQVKITLTDTIVQAIVANLSHKDRPLYAPVKKLCENLQLFVERCSDGDIQLTVITSLICQPGTVVFDAITNSKTVHNMVSKLTPEGCTKWTELMMDLVRGKTNTSYGDFSNQSSADLVQFALTELTRSITIPGLAKQSDWHPRLLKFLFLHGFFDIKEAVKDIPMCEPRVGVEFSDKSRLSIQNAVYKAMDRMATYRAPGERAVKDLRPYINMLYDVTQFVQLLLASDGKVELHNELLPEVLKEWQKVSQAVEDIRSKHIKEAKMGEGHAFELLFISLGLQLFSQPKDAIDIIEDLHVCYKKAFVKKRRMSIKPQAEPEWVEVVTEMLLSLLSQGSHLVRFVTTTVFRMLSPHMTKPALQLVLNVLLPEDEEGPLDFEDEDDEEEGDDDEGSKDSGVEDEGEKEEENELSEDESEEEEDEAEDMPVDETLRRSLKEALGKAAIDSEEEEDAASDLDDDAMFKLDDALAQAFKGMLKNKKNSKEEKERKQQLKSFKLRALDLLNGFVASDPPPHQSLELVFPLLELMDKGAQDKAMVDVGRKATTVFNNLVAPRKVHPDPQLEKEMLPVAIQKLIDFSARAHGVPLVLSVASACLFMIRVMLGIESNSGPSPVRTRSRSAIKSTPKQAKNKSNTHYDAVQAIITESLRSFCLKRDTHLNHMLFHTMFDRQSSIMWPQAQELLQLVQEEEVRVFCRTQVCGMLAVMMKKETVDGVGEEVWMEFSEKISQILPEMLLTKVDTGDIKPRFVHELLYLTLRICSVSQDMVTRLLTPEVVEKVNLIKNHVKKDTKAVCKKIVHLTEISRKRQKKQGSAEGASPTKKAKLTNGQMNGVTETLGSAKVKRKSMANIVEEASEEQQSEQRGEDKENKDKPLSKTPKKNLGEELLQEEEEPKSAKKKKRKSMSVVETDVFTEIKTPAKSDENKSKETSTKKKKKRKSEIIEGQSLAISTPQKNLIDELGDKADLSKSGKKKKRKSLSQDDIANAETPQKSPKKTPLQNGGDIHSVGAKGSGKKDLVDSIEDPDGVGADLELFTPKPKMVNRRRSTRLSLMSKPRGTPKADMD